MWLFAPSISYLEDIYLLDSSVNGKVLERKQGRETGSRQCVFLGAFPGIKRVRRFPFWDFVEEFDSGAEGVSQGLKPG
jgi:hypothetical protein